MQGMPIWNPTSQSSNLSPQSSLYSAQKVHKLREVHKLWLLKIFFQDNLETNIKIKLLGGNVVDK